MRQKIEFPTNTPILVTLDFNEGILKPGRFGDEFQYVVNHDEGIFWAKPELHQLIERSGARAGDEIAITKREVKDGRTKRVQWEVAKVEDEPPPPQRAPAPPPRSATAPAHTPAQPQPLANPLAQALRLAIDAAADATAYAAQRGVPMRLGSEDIRALAITAYIQAGGKR